VRYDLNALGEMEFEDLAQALSIHVLGPGVQVFGDGPDGGREAAFEGTATFPEPDPAGLWRGYGVIQAKFRRQPLGTPQDTVWLRRQITGELNAWSNKSKNRVTQGRLPQYLIFVTNVRLSSVPGTGGLDQVNKLIASYVDQLGLRGWKIWDYEQVCRFLDAYADIRQAYAAFTTPGDVLATLQEVLINRTAVDLGPALTAHAAKELLASQWVRLGQAGDANNDRLLLGDVAIDLPATAGGENDFPGILAEIIRRGDAVRRTDLPRGRELDIAVVGGPGQGKSTIGQLACQAYRLALLADRPDHTLSAETVEVRNRLRENLTEIRLPTPACRRWPVQVVLSKYGDAVAGGEDISLLRYIATQISRRSTEPITASQLREWLRSWPWLLVLDGLDEVAAPSVRETLLRNIADFFIDIADVGADVLVIATTRPQGYEREFPQRSFQHLYLEELSRADAIGYARRLAHARHRTDPDTAEQVLNRVTNACEDMSTGRLMTSPLQVTIMSLLLERRVRAPQDRYALFDGYYTAIFEREVGKDTPVAALLDQHRNHIHALHEQVGLQLQARSEHAGEAEASLTPDDLRQLAVARFVNPLKP
jgi:hypothetical protein